MKRFLVSVVMLLVLTSVGFAQVGGNDWTPLGNGFTITRPDGTSFHYRLNYSPASVTRDGDWVNVIFDMVLDDNSPTRFYRNRVNCKTNQYTYAIFDTSVTPARLSEDSDVRPIKPNSAGTAMVAILCK
jgi:hypothetical protein